MATNKERPDLLCQLREVGVHSDLFLEVDPCVRATEEYPEDPVSKHLGDMDDAHKLVQKPHRGIQDHPLVALVERIQDRRL